MEKSILDILIKKNEFPIIFVGSGIPRRYLVKYPCWEELLEELWSKTGNSNFYGYLSQKKDETLEKGVAENIDFEVNIEVASEIEKTFNHEFYKDNIVVEGLTQKDSYKSGLSPFKKQLANRFSKYQVKESYAKELELFRKMLIKSQMILTTNYDSFIEDQYNIESSHPIKKYIGQKGFFQQTIGYSELYKIHGCFTDPNSLVIGKKDYVKYDENSVLISAKVISMLLHSPIIFMGYSLTDRNVRKLIRSFTMALSEREKQELEKRLLLIQWDEGNQNIEEEIVSDPELGCRLTVLKTDNYGEIFEKLSEIDQGVAPSEVRRYQHVIKKLIIENGKSGGLQSVLLSPSELDDLEEGIIDKNIVVAIGDSKLIFKMPNIVEYILDYVSDEQDQNSDTILRFIASQNNAILPFWKYLSNEKIDKCNLAESEKNKLRKRLATYSDLSSQTNALQFKETYNSLGEIKSQHFKEYHEHIVVSYNIDMLGLEVVKDYLIQELKKVKDKGEITVSTQLRRLALIYDFKKNH